MSDLPDPNYPTLGSTKIPHIEEKKQEPIEEEKKEEPIEEEKKEDG